MSVAAILVLLAYTATGVRPEESACEPMLEACWADLATGVDCLFNPRSAHIHDCHRPNSTELFKAIEEALRCSSEAVDAGCVLRSGRESFDFWMRGLEAVNTKLYVDGLLHNILSQSACWDVLRFSHCVEHVEHLQHLVDLLHAVHAGAAGREQCMRLMLSVSKCAALGASTGALGAECAQTNPLDLLNELLAAYFSASECGCACPPLPAACPGPDAAGPAPAPGDEDLTGPEDSPREPPSDESPSSSSSSVNTLASRSPASVPRASLALAAVALLYAVGAANLR